MFFQCGFTEEKCQMPKKTICTSEKSFDLTNLSWYKLLKYATHLSRLYQCAVS